MNGLDGIRELADNYREQTGRTIEQVRISARVPRDYCYAGRFNGGPPEIVLGLDAWDRLAGAQASVLTSVHGIKVVDHR